MHKIIFLLIGIVLIAFNWGSADGDTHIKSDNMVVSKPYSTLSDSNINNNKYICGFTNSFAYTDNIPLAAELSSANDSVIERIFAVIWRDVVGGSLKSIKIEKDADQNNTEYKYAAAKGVYTDLGNIVRLVFYKSNDLSPLLHRNNGWYLKAIALHEFGHHINGHPFTGESRNFAELVADDYAGFMMGSRLRAPLDTTLLAFSFLTEEHPTNGYPDRQRRIEAVRMGWTRAQTPPTFSLVSALIKVRGINRDLKMTDSEIDYRIIQDAINKNGSLGILNDTSTLAMTKIGIKASSSPGEFFMDSNYLYFKENDSMSIVGKVANSNRPEYRQMVYDNFYNYMYIGSNNTLIAYVKDFQDPKKRFKPIIIGFLSERRRR